MRKISDKIILGLVVGMLADIPKNLICTSLYYSGVTQRKCSDLAGSLFIPGYKIFTKAGTAFGILCDFMAAGLNGIAYIYLLTSTGKVTKTNAVFKGWLTGIFSFGLLRGIISKVESGIVQPKDIFTNMMMGMSSSIWGITAGLLTLGLGDKDVLDSKSKTPNQKNPADEIEPSSNKLSVINS